MKDYTLTKQGLPQFMDAIQDELESEPVLIVTTQSAKTGKWGLARLWRMWMSTTGKWMAANGAVMPLFFNDGVPSKQTRPYNENDAHEAFTRYCLGCDANGNRLSWAKKDHDGMRAANQGERFDALRKFEQWAIEKGIVLFKPRGSEYDKLEKEQNA
jgi:hypothetical protein